MERRRQTTIDKAEASTLLTYETKIDGGEVLTNHMLRSEAVDHLKMNERFLTMYPGDEYILSQIQFFKKLLNYK